eukprot:298633-Chlamydomonas_euryale.AAC.8
MMQPNPGRRGLLVPIHLASMRCAACDQQPRQYLCPVPPGYVIQASSSGIFWSRRTQSSTH